jgi:glutamate formiminotransferase / 5-formyltetrahydrofolate cyclo-ligase
VLECVVNVSEGQALDRLKRWSARLGDDLLDLHHDPYHHRSVFTLVGEFAPRCLARLAVAELHIAHHRGVHPRIGVVDVVPFVPLGGATLSDAVHARDRFARWAWRELHVPSFLYGPNRSLPDLRRAAGVEHVPDIGGPHGHPSAGAIAVGARQPLVAYNLWLRSATLEQAREIAQAMRSPVVRTLGLAVGDSVQVSCNLVAPERFTPADAFDVVNAEATIERAELVGLLPRAVLDLIDHTRWQQLDLDDARTIEARLEARAARASRAAGAV